MSTQFLQTDEIFHTPQAWDDDYPPSIAVVETMAEVHGVEPTELDVTLYDIVDPDALDAIFLGGTVGDISVRLQVGRHLVTIRGDGSIQIEADSPQGPTG